MPRDKVKQYQYTREWKKRNPERVRAIERKRFLKRHYGLLPEQYEELLASQDHSCAICNKSQDEEIDGRHLAIDHCHETGAIRGILCNDCNRNLIRNRTLDTLKRAVFYMESKAKSNEQMGFAVPKSSRGSSDVVKGPLDEGRVRNRRPRVRKKDG